MKQYLFLLLSLFLFSCGSLKKAIDPPVIKVQEVRVDDMALSSADLSVVLEVANSNGINFDVKNLKYSLDIDGKVVTSGLMKEEVVVKAKDKTYVRLPIKVLYKDILKSAVLLLKKDGLPYRVQGSAEVGPFNLPFDEKGNLKTEDL